MSINPMATYVADNLYYRPKLGDSNLGMHENWQVRYYLERAGQDRLTWFWSGDKKFKRTLTMSKRFWWRVLAILRGDKTFYPKSLNP